MNNTDIRWQQRFDHFKKAFSQLDEAVQLMRQRPLSRLEKQGAIQAFEFTHELAWNTLKDYLTWQGIEGIVGSRDTTREAFSKNLIEDGDPWMGMLLDRKLSSHTYNEATAQAILENIDTIYHELFIALQNKMNQLLQRGS